MKSGESLGTLSLPLPLAVGPAGSSTRSVKGTQAVGSLTVWMHNLLGVGGGLPFPHLRAVPGLQEGGGQACPFFCFFS